MLRKILQENYSYYNAQVRYSISSDWYYQNMKRIFKCVHKQGLNKLKQPIKLNMSQSSSSLIHLSPL